MQNKIKKVNGNNCFQEIDSLYIVFPRSPLEFICFLTFSTPGGIFDTASPQKIHQKSLTETIFRAVLGDIFRGSFRGSPEDPLRESPGGAWESWESLRGSLKGF